MFGALKEKLKGALKKFTRDVEEASDVVQVKEERKIDAKAPKTEEIKEAKKEKAEAPEKKSDEPEMPEKEEVHEAKEELKNEVKEEKKGFFSSIKSMFSKKEHAEPKESKETEETPAILEVDKEEEKIESIQKDARKAVEELREEVKHPKPAAKIEASKFRTPDEEQFDEYITDMESKPTQGADIEDASLSRKEIEEITEKTEDIQIVEDAEEKETKAETKDEAKEERKAEVKEEKRDEIKKEVKAEKVRYEEKRIHIPEVKKEKRIEIKEEKTVAKTEPKKPDLKGEKKAEPKKLETIEEKKQFKAEEPKEEKIAEPKEEKRGFFSRITDIVTKTTLSEQKFEELFWDMEIALLENNVAVEVIEKIKKDLRAKLVGQAIKRGKLEDVIIETLTESISSLFDVEKIDLIEKIEKKKASGEPFVIAFVGVNGSGKTTTIAKMAKFFQNHNLKPVIAAADTFRAAAIQQLEVHATKLGVKLIKQDYGSDPAAVAFDAIKFAKQKGFDVVMIDTAGRLHSNTNLMDEMKKIIRVSKPDVKIFIGEAITGNDCVEQARQFNEAIGIDGIILCKADVDDKGGAAISTSFITGKPILYIGTGQGYEDLKEFDKSLVMKSLELDEPMYG